jgi:hypothetical protein
MHDPAGGSGFSRPRGSDGNVLSKLHKNGAGGVTASEERRWSRIAGKSMPVVEMPVAFLIIKTSGVVVMT